MGNNCKKITEEARIVDNIDSELIKRAKVDLTYSNNRIALSAAAYFFLDGRGIDEDDPLTFTALCGRNDLNPDIAAQAIWKQLKAEDQKRIRDLLHQCGYMAPSS